MAKNQTPEKDEQERVDASLGCEIDLVKRGVDVGQYNSRSIAKDFDALRKALKYDKWNVLGVSYGTYVAQVYANAYANDINNLILDSPISDISNYYDNRNSNFGISLQKVFDKCKADPVISRIFPDLEKKYEETIIHLEKKPLTVKIDKNFLASGEFSFNSEDFKILIQQALYSKELTEMIPVIINEFNKGDKKTIGALVGPFSGGLSLDFGSYYCISCDEVLPYNSIQKFDASAIMKPAQNNGLSFYKTDFKICDAWNRGKNNISPLPNDLSNLKRSNIPVLILAGEFDPITPISNGVDLSHILNGKLIKFASLGHALSFSPEGANIVSAFILSPYHEVSDTKAKESQLNFISDIVINGGVAKFAGSLSRRDILFFSPLAIALLVCGISIIYFIARFISKSKIDRLNFSFGVATIICSALGLFLIISVIIAVINANNTNFFICAFGLSGRFSYLFTLQWVFLILTFIDIVIFLLGIKRIEDKSIAFTIIFSLVLVNTYFFYWGFMI